MGDERANLDVVGEPPEGGGQLIYCLPWLLILGLLGWSFWRTSRLLGGGFGTRSELQRFL